MSRAGRLAWGCVLLVGIVHFDFWAWDDDTLVFGIVPNALAFHALLSVLAALSWALVVRFDWPEEVEEWARGPAGDASPTAGKDMRGAGAAPRRGADGEGPA